MKIVALVLATLAVAFLGVIAFNSVGEREQSGEPSSSSRAQSGMVAAPVVQAELNLPQIYREYDEDVRACPMVPSNGLLIGRTLSDSPDCDSGSLVIDSMCYYNRSPRCESNVRERYQRHYPNLQFDPVQ
jgi:hypothetical protein